jgi:hypothetical protein
MELIALTVLALAALAAQHLAARREQRRAGGVIADLRSSLAVSRELAAGQQARLEQTREERAILAEQLDHERAERRAEQERFIARSAQVERAHRDQVQLLLDRIQRPEVVPVGPGEVSLEDRKLHWSEQDEIDGITPGQVAAAAGGDVEETLAYIDEIARTEGV